MIAPFLPLAFHFAQHSKLQHGDLLSGCGCTLILSEIIQYVIFGVNTLFQFFSFRCGLAKNKEIVALRRAHHDTAESKKRR